MYTGAPWFLLVLPVVLGAVGLVAAVMDAALAATFRGRSPVDAIGSSLREGARLLVKQRHTTVRPDSVLWRLGTGGIPVVACVASVVVPLGWWSVADLPAGVVWWQGFVAVLWVLLHMVGYSANAAYPLVAGYRFLAQAMAYEMPMAISVICAALAAHSLRVGAVVDAQHGLWFAIWMPAAFVTFLICALAAAFYGPFATPTGVDLAGGVLAELSGVERLLLLGGRYLVLASAAGFATAVFLGGGDGPWLPPPAWSLVKTLAVLAVLVGARWRWPSVRMERFEEIAWVVLLPISVGQAFVVSLVVL